MRAEVAANPPKKVLLQFLSRSTIPPQIIGGGAEATLSAGIPLQLLLSQSNTRCKAVGWFHCFPSASFLRSTPLTGIQFASRATSLAVVPALGDTRDKNVQLIFS